MKLVNQKVDMWSFESDESHDMQDLLDAMWNHIERCTRVCYQSIPKTKESGEEFCKRTILANNHLGMLEHGTVYLTVPSKYPQKNTITYKYKANPYSKVFETDNASYITTNYRVIYENKWEKDLDFISEKTDIHYERVTLNIITSIGIARELCRHRHFSFAQESTRYVNYGKNEHIQFIIPAEFKLNDGIYFINDNQEVCGDGYIQTELDDTASFLTSYILFSDYVNELYSELLTHYKPQFARNVLPLCLKTQIIMTGFMDDWMDFINKRYYELTGKVHPDMKQLATYIFDILQ